ncbi:MAG: efflux RND transporter periplasmic adaptor subunit [Betaproteobacteria bacterium]|nr:MAG: efflux RND transporter periplasmic adaptor subunit [Betaproteobacteria bacterium]
MNATERTARIIGGAAVAITAVLLVACAKPEPTPEPVRPVQLMQVKLGGTTGTAVFAGEVKPRHEIDLGFRIGGKVIGRNVDVGARVVRGESLARLDPADAALQVDAQKAAVAAAETEYRYAKAEFDRYENLRQQKFISESALDQKRNALDANHAKWEQARSQLSVTQNQAAYATLAAPDGGVITAISVEAGQVVTAGQTVMKLAREDEREVSISVPESRMAELRAAPVLGVFLWANPQRIYAARVREISPAVDAVTRTFAVRVTILDPDPGLHWGMTANVVVPGTEAANATLFPLTSIYRKGNASAVWIYDEKSRTVSLRPIVVGQFREDGVIVTDGVARGEWIVTAGVHKLREGETVRPYEGSGDSASTVSPVHAPVIVPASPKSARNLT